jgi:hypothetical protein
MPTIFVKAQIAGDLLSVGQPEAAAGVDDLY